MSVREALARALADLGCPPVISADLASRARVEWGRPQFGEPGMWMLFVATPAADHGTEYPDEPDHVDLAVRQLALNIAAYNAEAWDRTTRGEQGWTTLWPLPDRTPGS